MGTERWTRTLIVIGVLAITAGIIVVTTGLIVTAQQPSSFGWFAYAPLSGEVYSPDGASLIPTTTVIGGVIFAAGCVASAFWAGLVIGARRSRQLP